MLSLAPAVLLVVVSVAAAYVSRVQLTTNARTLHLLTHGPVVGPVTSTSVRIWVRFSGPAEVRVRYSTHPDLRQAVDSPITDLLPETDFTGFIHLQGLQPGTRYYYTLVVNEQEVPFPRLLSFRTAPSTAGRFTAVVGANAESKAQPVWNTIMSLRPAFFLSAGNLVQVDTALSLEDARYAHRVILSDENFRRFAAETPVIVPFPTGKSHPETALQNQVQQAHREHWAPLNDGSSTPWQRFHYADVDFFILETHRSRTAKSVLGPDQWAWLEQEMTTSRAAFRVLVSEEPFHTWAERYPEDWQRLIRALDNQRRGDTGPTGVLLVSGGSPRTEVWHLEPDALGGFPLFEIMPGRLATGRELPEDQRCDATPDAHRLFCADQEAGFAAVHFDTSGSKPLAQVSLINQRGERLFGLSLQDGQAAWELPLEQDLTPGTLSGLTYDPEADVFWTHMDSGPGTSDWRIRLFQLRVRHGRVEVLSSITVTDEDGRVVTGEELDPEDIVLAPDGTFWMVDEYGPWLLQLDRNGRIIHRVEPPARFRDRVLGQGFEGVAISPDGQTVYAFLQSGLSGERDRTQTWLLAYDVSTETFREYPYKLDDPTAVAYPPGVKASTGGNGLVCVDQGRLLIIERDNKGGEQARIKRIYQVDVPATPSGTLNKSLVADLTLLGYRHEKLEGITRVGPGRVAVINDNDGNPEIPTAIWFLDVQSDSGQPGKGESR